jgi:hypothetical protein
MNIDLIEVQVPGPQGPPGASTPFYGQASRMTAGTINVASQGVYQATGLAATFDSANSSGVVLATTNTFGLRNTSGLIKMFRVYGSIDAKANNNEILGIKLAKNGVPIDATECRAFGGSSQQEAKLVTSWMISLADNEEVSLFIANHSGTHQITLGRARILMSALN